MMNRVKAFLGITSSVFDEEIQDNIDAALADMGLTDITNLDTTDPLIYKAVASYCACQHNLAHGNMERSERYKISYDEQKRQLITASDYTTWSE